MLGTIFNIIPGESGFSLFGLRHIMILLISTIMSFIIIKVNKKSELFEKVISLIMLFIQICLYIWYYFSTENFIVKGLPLHSCRMALCLLVIGIFLKKDVLLKIGSYCGIFGGIFGLLLPTIHKYAFPHILHISSFSLHVYLLVMSVYFLFVKNIGMSKQDFIICNIFTVSFLIFTFIVNLIIGSHYSYTTRMPSTLLKMGVSIPPIGCCLIVIAFYVALACLEYVFLKWRDNKIKQKEENLIG